MRQRNGLMAQPGTIRSGFASETDAAAAVAACRAVLGGDEPGSQAPSLLLAFVGGRHDPAAMLAALQQAFPGAKLVGGSAAGAISTAGAGYTGFELGIIAFQGADVTPEIVTVRTLLAGEREAGRTLGEAVRARCTDDTAVMLWFDSVAEAAPLRLHPASWLLDGFRDGLAGRTPHVVGGGLLTDINITGGWVFDGEAVVKHAAVALIFPPALRPETVILHGCRPVSAFIEITGIAGAEVLELDHEPALSLIERMLGLEPGSTSGQELFLIATLGQKQGDPFAPYDENNYVNRLILKADPTAGSVTLFEPDFTTGAKVQIMSRDNGLMLDSVRRGVAALKQRLRGRSPLFGLYIDCAGRASIMSGAAEEEAQLVLDTLAPAFPFMGLYSGVEIAPVAGKQSRPLDWTGVLTIFHRDA